MEYENCASCGGKVVDGKPHYIPLGADSVLRIVDQVCAVCGGVIIGPHQKTKIIRNQEAHDLLIAALEGKVKSGKVG